MRRISTPTLLALLLPLGLAGAGEAGYRPQPRFERITLQDGLPDNTVTAILQDHLGFLWLGTPNGLARYDGYQYLTYKPDREIPGSLSGRTVTALLEDRDGTLWVGTRQGGLNRLDRATGTFSHYRHDPGDPRSLSFDTVSALYEDRDGVLWVGTGDPENAAGGGGLNRLDDRQAGRFARFVHDPGDPASLAHDVVGEVREDEAGRLWIASPHGGLQLFHRDSGTFTRLRHDPDDPASPPSDTVAAIHPARDGGFWLGTWDAGLVRFDPERRAVACRECLPAELGKLAVSALYEDSHGTLWIGVWGGPLVTFDPATGALGRYEHDPEDPASLGDAGGVATIFEDRTGIVWIGTYRGGLNKLDPYAGKFHHIRHQPGEPYSLVHRKVNAIHRDRAGRLWVGTDGGVDRFDPATENLVTYRHDPADPGSLSSDRVGALLEDREGAVWLGTWGGGLDRWDPASGVFSRFRYDPDDPAGSPASDWIHALAQDPSGDLWVASNKGLSRRDRATGAFTHYRHDPGDPGSLGNDYVFTLHVDRQGTLWIGAEGAGLMRFDGSGRGSFTRFVDRAHGLDTVLAIHEDSRGGLWVGTHTGGLHLFDRDAASPCVAFTERDGLAHDTVYAILEDAQGHLWLSTGAGVSRLDPATGKFRNYGTKDGLQSQLGRAAARTPGGELLFGGTDGINLFHPDHVADNPYPPPVVLTDFKVFNSSVEPGASAMLETNVGLAREVRVAHRQNVLTFEFAGLHFGHPESNRYRYRLDGFSHDWTEVDGRNREATFTNLDPGRYVFRVKAANADGVWGDEETSIVLHVEPPWWRTGWAWAGYGLALAGLVFAADRIQRARLVRREREEARRREAQLRAEAAELQARAAEAQALALQAENDRQTQELEEARRVQLSLLPESVPWHPEVEIAASMQTAAEVGGDYYDFHVADDGTLTLAVGDATGHGTGTGTMVAATKSLFHHLADGPCVAEALGQASRALQRMRLTRLHMALALARLKDGRLEVASAAMPPVYLVRAGGSVEEVALEGMPLGCDIRFPYGKRSLAVAPGDIVVFMSDGFAEMVDGDGEVFGYERVAAAVRDAAVRDAAVRDAAGGTPREVIDRLEAVAASWADGGGLHDDMTFVVMKLRR